MSSFTRVATLSDLPDGSLLGVQTATGDRICLVNRGGEVSALADVCTHQAFPISAGQLLDDGSVECVWHGARFDCRSGAVRQGPASDDLPVYAVKVVGGEIHVGPRGAGREP